jgi:hypothetical protein
MAIIVGIDGTGGGTFPGADRDRQYDIDFAHSFVRRIAHNTGPNSKYLRGPVTLGGGLVAAIDEGFRFITSRQAAGVREPIVLTGYSRGAAGVVSLAKKVKDAGKNVRALMLFDCVDRHLFIDAEVIPNNVGYVMHVIRHPDSGSRESFSNDGMRFSPPTVYPAAYTFMCTHGGMGGCPWVVPVGASPSDYIDEGGTDGMTNITYQQDWTVSPTVWAYVQPFLRTHGFI